MITEWLETLGETLSQNLWLGLLIALIAGVLTSFTPCSLSSIPLVIGYVSGYTDNKRKAFFYSLIFCIGMVVTFTIIGIFAALIGRLFLGIMMYWYIFLGLLMTLMALETWEVIRLFPQKCGYTTKKKGILGALSLGVLGAIFSSPCSTPVLIAILAVVSTGQSLVMGALMLLLYSAGHSILLIVAGTSVGWVQEITKSEKFEKTGKIVKILMGFVLFALALYLFYMAF
jgi:cytochrome c biogenesis protein CcdA